MATYHMPVITAWEGKPSMINPALAGATKRKSDPLDAARLPYHDLTEVWHESFPTSREIHELRVLIAAREHIDKPINWLLKLGIESITLLPASDLL